VETTGDFVMRVNDDRQGFEPGNRVEIFSASDDLPRRTVQKVPFGPYRVVKCDPVLVHGTPKLDLTLRKLRRPQRAS
jgi:hypothetical protein